MLEYFQLLVFLSNKPEGYHDRRFKSDGTQEKVTFFTPEPAQNQAPDYPFRSGPLI
jgi:hypothetical protein